VPDWTPGRVDSKLYPLGLSNSEAKDCDWLTSFACLRKPPDLLGGKLAKADRNRGVEIAGRDDIIMCRNIESVNTEERKNETQNNKTSTSVSIQQSDADKHRQQRGYSRFRNNVEERNDKKPNQEPFGFESGQSSLNRQPLKKQEKCNENSKAQEANQRRTNINQKDLKANQKKIHTIQRDLEATQRGLVADQRDLMVDQKDLVAKKRDLMVHQKDLVADQRDLMVNQRDLMAN
ncbi:hypothetical protein E2I00_008691, partial [Balaenoptera physalus]